MRARAPARLKTPGGAGLTSAAHQARQRVAEAAVHRSDDKRPSAAPPGPRRAAVRYSHRRENHFRT
ncbi:hypothetical protein GCM10009548_76110 [Streptomyces malaysiensis subsp. malaysiensis]